MGGFELYEQACCFLYCETNCYSRDVGLAEPDGIVESVVFIVVCMPFKFAKDLLVFFFFKKKKRMSSMFNQAWVYC